MKDAKSFLNMASSNQIGRLSKSLQAQVFINPLGDEVMFVRSQALLR